ncbi:peptide chain release factor N(5)-glutamine methyltransferase [Lentibacillus amyloliquefaciens]|uniref:Release factor glutamine methyltransferase n=1 Tax=Lentibacillus amyloliquefaciens TaxID=1472767 RepID=A0A0U4FPT3_9BACI|nr:peptide chain release factor N(5)-glutamine methyltransferase [Lentibacillus amyloliquefaciens]ALX50670.1 protein-(glutamine-N5) methyltransferase, release factor-specific [Lentibacillus amyloliquefaciens]
MKQHEVLRRASLFLEENNREPKMAELLLQHYLGVSRSKFFTMMNEEVPESVLNQFHHALTEHAETGVPFEHITGFASFYSRDFLVNEYTLIPRPETEELIAYVVQTASAEPMRIADIGTGSGIIAITLALELPQAIVYATDISKEALKLAEKNAARLGADITFLEGDYLEPLIDHKITTDLIISNPPYISPDEKMLLSDTVKNFDPKEALFAEDNGLAAYKAIIRRLRDTLNQNGGNVLFEIGHRQGSDVQGLLQTAIPEMDVSVIRDINGKQRIVHGFCDSLASDK